MGATLRHLAIILLLTGILLSYAKGSLVRMASPRQRARTGPLDRTGRRPAVVYDAADDQAKCRFGRGWANFAGGCYLVTQKGIAWSTAAKACHAIDPQAEFGTLWSTADMDFVAQMARSQNVRNVYVNARYEPQTSDFRWHLKRPVTPEYTQWGPGEPRTKAVGQAVVLHTPVKIGSSHLSVLPIGTTLPILCKRPAKGFRRRTPNEIQAEYTNRLQHGPAGWFLSKEKNSSKDSVSRQDSQPRKESGGRQRQRQRQPQRQPQPKPSGRVADNAPTGRATGNSAPASALAIADSESTTVPPPRTLPPPISQNRKFLSKPGHFKPVLPDTNEKDSKKLEVSAIEPVDVVDIVKAREDKLNEIFGRSKLRLKESMAHYPEDYRYPTTDYQRMAHVLTTELIAQDQRERKTEAPFEKAKVLTMRLFYEGRAIQCFFGEKDEPIGNWQVECIAIAGVIESCVKQVLLSGKIIRGCGLPGTDRATKKAGCVQTTNGEICYCDRDNCNGALQPTQSSFCIVFIFFCLSEVYRRVCGV